MGGPIVGSGNEEVVGTELEVQSDEDDMSKPIQVGVEDNSHRGKLTTYERKGMIFTFRDLSILILQ